MAGTKAPQSGTSCRGSGPEEKERSKRKRWSNMSELGGKAPNAASRAQRVDSPNFFEYSANWSIQSTIVRPDSTRPSATQNDESARTPTADEAAAAAGNAATGGASCWSSGSKANKQRFIREQQTILKQGQQKRHPAKLVVQSFAEFFWE